MEKKLRDALKKYSALAGATAAVTAASGQIEYTDVNPDSTFSGNHQFDFDLNNDLIMDFRITASSTSSYWSSGTSASSSYRYNVQGGALNSNAVLLDSSGYVQALSLGAIVSSGASYSWTSASNRAMGSAYFRWWRGSTYITTTTWTSNSNTYYSGYSTTTSTSYTGSYGPWAGSTQNRFMGLRLTVGSDTYYGWARLDTRIVNGGNDVVVKDFAFQTCPNIPIHAGDSSTIYAPVATSVMGADIGNNGDGTDLQVSFTIPSSEVGITEYRIFVVDSADAANFNVDSAKAVPTANYTTHTPNAANYNSALLASSTDVKGNLIVNNQPYVIFVMSLHDGVNTNDPILSAGSPVVTLMNPGVGIEENNVDDWSVFARDEQIVIEGANVGAEYSVLDASGRLIENGRVANNRTVINMSGQADGVYLVNIKSDNDLSTKKVFVR